MSVQDSTFSARRKPYLQSQISAAVVPPVTAHAPVSAGTSISRAGRWAKPAGTSVRIVSEPCFSGRR